MSFEENRGQAGDEVRFLSRGPGYALMLTPSEAILSLRSSRNASDRRVHEQAFLTMRFIGANPRASIKGTEPLEGTASYFIGSDPAQWQTGVPTYGRVKYDELYPGIDLVYYGNQREAEYDFIVRPHANPQKIRISFSGAKRLKINGDGDLIAELSNGAVRWKKPYVYQETSSGKTEVAANFILKRRSEVGFQVGSYDTTRELIIDPVLVYATYLGSDRADFVSGIAVDATGNAYILGDTPSVNFPTTTGAFRRTSGGSNEVFVAKLNSSGSGLVFSTYLGGSGDDLSAGLAVDSSGNVYVTGRTLSPNFPTRNPAFASNAGFNDAFVTKIGPFGTNLVYSTYLGGSGDDYGRAIAVDSGGNAYVAGTTYSKGSGNGPFPTTQGAYQGNNGGGNVVSADAFVTKFDTNGALSYSTFLGGSTDEDANGIAVDTNGNAYVVGEVLSYPDFPNPPSSDFPLLNAYQSSFNQGNVDPLAGNTDGFLTKLNATGTGLIFSTFLGGNDNDNITGVALDAAGRVHVVGITSSTNFPVLNAAQPLNGGSLEDPDFPGPDAFVTKFETNGTSLLYSTYLGGSIDEFPFLLDRPGIAVDKFGAIYVAGRTGSLDFPVTVGADQTFSEAIADAFVVKINPAVPGPASIIYATLLSGDTSTQGGGANNEAGPIAVDANGAFYVAGITSSTNFPVKPGAFQSTNSGGVYDAFVAKFSSPPDISVTMVPSLEPVIVGSNVTYTLQINNNGRSTFSGVSNLVQFTSNVRFGPITSSLGNFSTNSSGLVTFNVGTLTNNASVFQTIVVTNLTPGLYTNTATLTSIETPALEPNTGNNIAIVPASIRGISDVTIAQTAAPSPVSVSSNLVYTITVNNKGPSAATFINLTDALPASVSFVAVTNTQGTCSNIAGVVYCDLGTIANGTNARVTITVAALTNGVVTNVAAVSSFEADFSPNNNTSTLLTTINPLADLALGMTASTNSVFVGSNITFTLAFTNQVPTPASGVVITNPLPPGATLISATTTAGTTNLSTGVVAFNIGPMAGNATATATLTLRFDSAASVTNTAAISSPGASDATPQDNTASVAITVNPVADLALGMTASTNSVFVGSNITFTLAFTNRVPFPASGVVITNPLPPGATLISATTTVGTTNLSAGVVAFNIGPMAGNATATATLTLRFNSAASVTNTAAISSSAASDDIPQDNTASAAITVNPITDLALGMTAPTNSVFVGSNITFTLAFTNRVSSPASGVVITNPLPPGATLISATTTAGTTNLSAGVVAFNIGAMAGNATATATLTLRFNSPTSVTNTAAISPVSLDVTPQNNTASVAITVNPVPDLALGMTAPTNSVFVGSNITFTLAFTNQAPSPASGVVITNPLPPGATLISATTTAGTTNLSAGVVAFNIGTMTGNAAATASITLKFNSAASVTNTAAISSSAASDATPQNNTASVAITVNAVNAAADLAVSQSVSPTTAFISSNATFTIVLTNRGPSAATNVVLTNSLPAALVFVSAQWNGPWSQNNGVITFTTNNLPSGASATATILVNAPTEGVFTSEASVGSDVTDPVAANNSATTNLTVTENPSMPTLRVTLSSNNVILSWSTNAVNFVLQSKTNLSDASWIDVPDSPTLVGPRWMVTNSVSGAGKLYRLQK